MLSNWLNFSIIFVYILSFFGPFTIYIFIIVLSIWDIIGGPFWSICFPFWSILINYWLRFPVILVNCWYIFVKFVVNIVKCWSICGQCLSIIGPLFDILLIWFVSFGFQVLVNLCPFMFYSCLFWTIFGSIVVKIVDKFLVSIFILSIFGTICSI